MAAGVAPEGFSQLAAHAGSDAAQAQRALGHGRLPGDRLPGDQLLLGPETETAAREPRRGRSRAAGDLRKARHPPRRAEDAHRGRRRRGVRQRLGGDDLQGQARRARHHLLLLHRGRPQPPRAGAQVPRFGGALQRQLLRRPQLRGLHRRLLRLHPGRGALPDGAVDLLPHQRRQHRAVRAHPGHRRRGRLRELSRGLPARLGGDQLRRPPAEGQARRARHHLLLATSPSPTPCSTRTGRMPRSPRSCAAASSDLEITPRSPGNRFHVTPEHPG